MKDATSQHPIYLLDVATGQNRCADIESFSRVTGLLRSEKIPFKVLEADNGPLGPRDVIVVHEDYSDQVFELANSAGVTSLVYLDFDRVAWQVSDSFHTSKQVLGRFKATKAGLTAPGTDTYLDRNRMTTYVIDMK